MFYWNSEPHLISEFQKFPSALVPMWMILYTLVDIEVILTKKTLVPHGIFLLASLFWNIEGLRRSMVAAELVYLLEAHSQPPANANSHMAFLSMHWPSARKAISWWELFRDSYSSRMQFTVQIRYSLRDKRLSRDLWSKLPHFPAPYQSDEGLSPSPVPRFLVYVARVFSSDLFFCPCGLSYSAHATQHSVTDKRVSARGRGRWRISAPRCPYFNI
jgi:hypothetical protein